MNKLTIQAIGGLLFLLVVLAAALFLSAGTLAYGQAWVFLAVFGVSVLVVTLYLMKHDTGLLERRVKAGPGAEQQASQKVIQTFAQLAFIAMFILPGLDYRFGWSTVPLFLVVVGDVLVVLGLYIVFLVFKENSYTSAIIEVKDEQKLISTGPYAVVRHPMYTGALVMLLGVPLALSSWWGLLSVIPMVVVIVTRLLDEEKFLTSNLPGYAEYSRKVRYHLAPYIW
jgi:protein-S-isoprenylcysteine O-methyltransferase Ste14